MRDLELWSLVFASDEHSHMMGICLCFVTSLWFKAEHERHLSPTSTRVCLNIYLIFLLGPSWLSELSWESGRSAAASSEVTQSNRSRRKQVAAMAVAAAGASLSQLSELSMFVAGGEKYLVQFLLDGFAASCRTFGTQAVMLVSIFLFNLDLSPMYQGWNKWKQVCVLNVAEGNRNCVQTE